MLETARAAKPTVAKDFKRGLVEMLPHLRNFARSLTRNPAQADDLVQDTIVKALANVDRFDPDTNLRPWLFTILRNTFYSELRRRWREVEDGEGHYAARLHEAPRQDGKLDFDDFKKAFSLLQDEHREVLTLIGASGCSYDEASEICGCAVGTIKSRVNRGRRRLEELMADANKGAASAGEPDARRDATAAISEN